MTQIPPKKKHLRAMELEIAVLGHCPLRKDCIGTVRCTGDGQPDEYMYFPACAKYHCSDKVRARYDV